MDLTLNYTKKDFFGFHQLYSDKTDATPYKLEKAFEYFKKHWDSTIWLTEKFVFSWDGIAAFDSGLVTITYSKVWNCKDWKLVPIREAKKIAKQILAREFVWEGEDGNGKD